MSSGPVEPQVNENSQEEVPPTTEPAPESEESGGDNPAWAPILQDIPAPFHEKLKGHLKEWDRGVNKRFQDIHESYAPVKKFVDDKVDPNRLALGLRWIDAIDQDPVGVYERLAQSLRQRGLIKEAEQAQQKADEIAEEQEEQGQQEFKDPRLDSFMQQLQQAQEEIARSRAEEEADRQIAQELQQVETLHGRKLTEKFQKTLLEKASAMYQEAVDSGRRPPTLVDAYKDLISAVDEIRGPSAPTVIPGSGGGQPAPQPLDTNALANDSKARREAAVALLQRVHQKG